MHMTMEIMKVFAKKYTVLEKGQPSEWLAVNVAR